MQRTWPFVLALAVLAACSGGGPRVGSQLGVAKQVDTSSWKRQTEGRVGPAWQYPLTLASAQSEGGMVASDDSYATLVGAGVLERGGNAIDAAVATAFALAVTFPEAGNIGGGGFMVLRSADGRTAALDFRETAPRAASRNMYLDAQGNVTENSVIGHLSAGVPGAVAGLWTAHKQYGSRPWAELVQPAIELAERGVNVNLNFVTRVRGDSARLARYPSAATLMLPGGRVPQGGTTWRNPELAAVLRRIAERGPAGFYTGETAQLIVAEMKRGNGLITLEDLAAYEAKWRDPVSISYRGHTVLSMPPSSSGGITLGLALNILEGYDLRTLGWHTPEMLHVLAEAERRAFADRNHFLGDPDFVKIPRDLLLSKDYANRLRATIDPKVATPSLNVRPGLGAASEGTHTTHVSVMDNKGGAVALTTTLNDLYGSHVVVSGGGFFLNDEMDDFASKPGTPNMFGLVQGEANAIAPGKRMLSAMTPTIVLDSAGKPLLVTGARGGPRIISATLQILLNVIDYGMDAGAAVSAPRIHHQHLPDTLRLEPGGFTQAQIDALRALGHNIADGSVAAAPTVLRKARLITGTADPRTGGLAEGY
jgi:gamma-glutamyltranspeptidase/glutathione hydrolase